MLKSKLLVSLKSFFVILIICIIDLQTKAFVFNFLNKNGLESYSVFPYFNIVMVYNKGITFGMFRDFEFANILFIVVASIITIGLFVYAIVKSEKLERLAFIIICGGSIGNIYDRLAVGAVRDFLDFYVANYHWPAFNVADSAICIGAFLYAINIIKYKKK